MKNNLINALREKKIVGFPTDTVYGIGCIIDKECVKRLMELKKSAGNKPFSIFIPDVSWLSMLNVLIPDYAKNLVKDMRGPLTIVFKILDDKFDFISKNGKIGVRIPDDDFLCDVLKELKEPIVATSANISGFAPPISSEEIDISVDFFIKGESKRGIPSTVIDISGEKPVILRKGAMPILEIESKTGEIFISENQTLNLLFVCSGNTCRSPMAEYHFNSISKGNNFIVNSCGTMNIYGMPSSIETVIVMKEIDIDITSHLSKGISREIIDVSDIILPMGKKHTEILISYGVNKYKIFPYYKILGLQEIPDPIGQNLSIYRKVRNLIIESNKLLFEMLYKKFLKID